MRSIITVKTEKNRNFDKKTLALALLSRVEFFFTKRAQDGELIVRCTEGESFLYWGHDTSFLSGTAGSVSKAVQFTPGCVTGFPKVLTREYAKYGFLLLVTCKKAHASVYCINLQKLGQYTQRHDGARCLIPIPSLVILEPWPYDQLSWVETLRRLLLQFLVDGRSVYMWDGQSIVLSGSLLKYYANLRRKIGGTLKFAPPFYPETYPPIPSLRFRALRKLKRDPAY